MKQPLMSDETCPGTNNRGEACGLAAGWGTDNDTGPCKFHGGAGGDVGDPGGAPEGNTSAVRHGLYAETNAFYQQVASDQLRALIDDIFADYLDLYVERHGDPPLGDEAQLFEIAVALGKEIRGENWAVDKPDDLDAGNPLIDRETHYSESGERYHRYKESVILPALRKLSKERRQWLKSLGLLPESEERAEAAAGLISILSEESNRDG